MRITLATIKSFIRKNPNSLYIMQKSTFDGMVDCVMPCGDGGFKPVKPTEDNISHSLGISGAWFVKSSRDYYYPYEADGFKGFTVSNCCGSFTLAIKA